MGGIQGYFGNAWTYERTLTSAVGGGIGSEIEGQSFGKGAIIAGTFAGAAEIYEDIVSIPADLRPGGPVAMKNATDGASIDGTTGLPANNFGLASNLPINQRVGFMEGASFSNFMNQIPGVNAIATLHDAILAGVSGIKFYILNVPTMPPAIAITLTALAAKYPEIEGAVIEGSKG